MTQQEEIQAETVKDAIHMAAWRREMAGTAEPGDTVILEEMRRDYAAANAAFETLLRKSAAVLAGPVKKHVLAVCTCVMAG